MNAKFAEQVLEQEILFHGLVQCVNQAANATILSKSVAETQNHVCIAGMQMENLNRRHIPLELKLPTNLNNRTIKQPIVHFNKNSITLTGGGAVKAYDFVFQRQIGAFNPFYKTPDLDFVWWPTIHLPTTIREDIKSASSFNPASLSDSHHYITSDINPFLSATEFTVVSSSPAIQSVISVFQKELETQLKAFIVKYQPYLSRIIHTMFHTHEFSINAITEKKNLYIAGICNIFGSLLLNIQGVEYKVQIIEFTIHDGASSQISKTLEPATKDPVYTVYHHPIDRMESCTKIHNGTFEYSVPLVDRLFYQQLFALQKRHADFLSTISDERISIGRKVYSHFQRCMYLLFRLCYMFLQHNLISRDIIFFNPRDFFNFYQSYIQTSEEWISSCTENDIEQCGILSTNPVFQRLCSENRMLHSSLCMRIVPPAPTYYPTQVYTSFPAQPPQPVYTMYTPVQPIYHVYQVPSYPTATRRGGKTRRKRH